MTYQMDLDLPSYDCDCKTDPRQSNQYQCSCGTQTRYPAQTCSCTERQGQYLCSCSGPGYTAPSVQAGGGAGGFPSKQCLETMRHNDQLLDMLQRVNSTK